MSIRIRHLEIPDAVRAGNEATLTCDYDLEVRLSGVFIVEFWEVSKQILLLRKNIKISLIFPSMLNYLININNCRRVKLCKQ